MVRPTFSSLSSFSLHHVCNSGLLSQEPLTQQDHLEQAAAYIKTLKERIEQLKQKKEAAINESLEGYGGGTVSGRSGGAADLMVGLRLPLVEIRARESTIEAVLICVPHRRPLFYDLIAVLEEEGADVVNASFSTVNDKTFYTVHAQVSPSSLKSFLFWVLFSFLFLHCIFSSSYFSTCSFSTYSSSSYIHLVYNILITLLLRFDFLFFLFLLFPSCLCSCSCSCSCSSSSSSSVLEFFLFLPLFLSVFLFFLVLGLVLGPGLLLLHLLLLLLIFFSLLFLFFFLFFF